jgi:hypothetical protein
MLSLRVHRVSPIGKTKMNKILSVIAMLAMVMTQVVNAASDDATFLETVTHGYADSIC